MKKLSLVVTSLVFCIAAVFIFPTKEANANPLAVGGALYLGGAGVYVLGAVAVGGIAGLAGCVSCQEDIEAHAQRTWDGSTQLAKDGLQLMVDASVGAWGATSSALTATDAGFNTWLDSTIDSFGSEIYNIVNGIDSGIMAGVANTSSTIDNRPYFDSGSLLALGMSVETGQFLVANGKQVKRIEMYFTDYGKRITITNMDSTTKVINFVMSPAELSALQSSMRNATTHVLALHLLGTLGISASYLLSQVAVDSYTSGVSNTREAWQDMRDAGLVLPVDNARPMMGDIPLSYNPTTDTYAGIDGVTVPHEDVTGFDFGRPHWKTLEDLAALGLAGLGAGLYVDGWTGSDSVTSTYDPATDITTTVTSTGTTTNVTTGETSITGSTTTTTTGDTTGNPPVDPPPVVKPGEPLNPFNAKPMPIAAIMGLFQLLAALIFYLIRLFTFIATIAFIAPTPIDNPYFLWFIDATFYGIKPFPLVQNLALFFLGFSVYRSVRRVFG